MSTKTRGYLISVELRYINEFIGHGVFALEDAPSGTALWSPVLVEKLTPIELTEKLEKLNKESAHEYLRQGFVLSSDLDHFCVNVHDLGRFTNHSSNPNVGYADFASNADTSVALRDIKAGDELTCDYSGLGSPQWYKDLCKQYNVLSTDEVAKLS